MDPELQAIFFAVAVILFVLAAFRAVTDRIHLGWLGAAVTVFVLFWNALEAT